MTNIDNKWVRLLQTLIPALGFAGATLVAVLSSEPAAAKGADRLPGARTVPASSNGTVSLLESAVLAPGQLALWQNKGAYVIAFEPVGTTYRDFTIPLSSFLIGKISGLANPARAYLYQRLIGWPNSTGFTSSAVDAAQGDRSFELRAISAPLEEPSGTDHGKFSAFGAWRGLGIRLGEGSGSYELLGQSGFALRSDFDPATGGVDPILGFASGGAYAQASATLVGGLRLAMGFSQKTDDHILIDPDFGPRAFLPLPPNRANAALASASLVLSSNLTFNASATVLNEESGIFGAQGGGALDLSSSHSRAMTLGLKTTLADGWQVSASGTLARTVGADSAALSIAGGGLVTTAFALSGEKQSVFADVDSLRLTLTQPLHVEAGALAYSGLEVTDRTSGTLGLVTQTWQVGSARELRLEAAYARPVFDGRADLSLFGLADINPPLVESKLSVSVGAQLRMALR